MQISKKARASIADLQAGLAQRAVNALENAGHGGNEEGAAAQVADMNEPAMAVAMPAPVAPAEANAVELVVEVPLDMIEPGKYQPRKDLGDIPALAATIASQGLKNPVILRPIAGGKYELIAGERRWTAMKSLPGKTVIPAFIRNLTDEQAAIDSLLENNARDDLSDYEYFAALHALQVQGFVKSDAEIRQKIGLPKSTMSRLMSFRSLPEPVRELLDKKPRTVGSKAAAALAHAKFSSHPEIVIEAVQRRFDNDAISEAAMVSWAESALRGAPVVAEPRMVRFGDELALFKVNKEGILFLRPTGIDNDAWVADLLKKMGATESE